MRRSSPALLALLSLASCHLRLRDGIVVDGERLELHHEEVLSVEAWPATGLVVEAHQGDLSFELTDEATPGAGTITVELYERELGRARAELVDGRLVARTADGTPCAIGRVQIRTRAALSGDLRLATGMGRIEVEGARVGGALRVQSGMGDVELSDVEAAGAIELETGMGDIALERSRSKSVEASSGMGDIDFDSLESTQTDVSSGMGDVSIRRSKLGRVRADTGMGSIECKDSTYEESDFDSGLGSIRTQ